MLRHARQPFGLARGCCTGIAMRSFVRSGLVLLLATALFVAGLPFEHAMSCAPAVAAHETHQASDHHGLDHHAGHEHAGQDVAATADQSFADLAKLPAHKNISCAMCTVVAVPYLGHVPQPTDFSIKVSAWPRANDGRYAVGFVDPGIPIGLA